MIGIVSRLTAAEGPRPAVRHAARVPVPPRRALRGARQRRGALRVVPRLAAGLLPGQGLVLPRLQRGARALDRGRRRHLPDALALRAVRPQPDVQPALRHAAGRAAHRRPRRHRRALEPGRPRRAPASCSTTSRPRGCAGRSTTRSASSRTPRPGSSSCSTAWRRTSRGTARWCPTSSSTSGWLPPEAVGAAGDCPQCEPGPGTEHENAALAGGRACRLAAGAATLRRARRLCHACYQPGPPAGRRHFVRRSACHVRARVGAPLRSR